MGVNVGRAKWPRMKATQIAAVLIATLATIVSGSISLPGQRQPLKALADWLQRTGKESVVRARILEAWTFRRRICQCENVVFDTKASA